MIKIKGDIILLVLLIVVFSSCKKTNKEVNPTTDSLENSWKIITAGEQIISDAIQSAKTNNTSLDYQLIVNGVKGIKGVRDAYIDDNEINVKASDGSSLTLITLTKNDSQLFPGSTFTINNNSNVSVTPSPITSNTVFPTSKKAIIIAPFDNLWHENIYYSATLLRDAGYSVDIFPNDKATTDVFTGDFLAQYGVIYISTHGLARFNYKGQINPILLTGQVCGKDAYFKLSPVQQATIRADGTPENPLVNYFAVTDDYIRKTLTKKFPNSWVFLNSCQSAKNDLLANVFLENGAMVVSGNMTNVDNDLANALGIEMISYLTAGYDFKQANSLLEFHQGLSGMIAPLHNKIYIYSLQYKMRTNVPFTLVNNHDIFATIVPAYGPNFTNFHVKIDVDADTFYHTDTIGIGGSYEKNGTDFPTFNWTDNHLNRVIGSIDDYVDFTKSTFNWDYPKPMIFHYTFINKSGKIIGSTSVPFTGTAY